MYQLDNEKFGTFLNKMRKEKNMMQKELAERLFVSDKTVSKWERGASMPNVALLIPIAEVLEITVTELLRGERMERNETLNMDEYLFLFLSKFPIICVEESFYISGMMLLFAGVLCFWVRDILPGYYDENKINFVTQGFFRVNMIGLSFNNNNWLYVCAVFRISTIVMAVVCPIILYCCILLGGRVLWNQVKAISIVTMLFMALLSVYIIGKKYE